MINDEQELEKFCGIKSFFNKLPIRIPFHLIKTIPENFIVKEILPNMINSDVSLNLGKSEPGLYYHALLMKRLIDTPNAVNLIAKLLNIPSNWIGYAGLKDSQGITFQRISIFNTKYELLANLNFNHFSLSNFIRKRYEVQLGQLWGNNFSLTLDALNDSTGRLNLFDVEKIMEKIPNFQFPNFFGLQRFGSTRPVSHLIGKSLIKNDYESAVITYLTHHSSVENKKIADLRKKLSLDFDYQFFLDNIPKNYHYEVLMAKSLIRYPNNFFRAFNELPIRMRKFFVSSFQSYIFNELLSEYIENLDNETKLIAKFPIISYNTDTSLLPPNLVSYLEKLLKYEGILNDDFLNVKNFYKLSKPQFRNTFVQLIDFKYKLNYEKLILNFSLPKSCYATMVLRELKGIY